MDRLEKRAEDIMRRGDLIIAERKRKSALIRRTAYAVSGLCAVALIGTGIWHNRDIFSAPDRKAHDDFSVITETTETTAEKSVCETTSFSITTTKADTTATTEKTAETTAETTTATITFVNSTAQTTQTTAVSSAVQSTAVNTDETVTTAVQTENTTSVTQHSDTTTVYSTIKTTTFQNTTTTSSKVTTTTTVAVDLPTITTTISISCVYDFFWNDNGYIKTFRKADSSDAVEQIDIIDDYPIFSYLEYDTAHMFLILDENNDYIICVNPLYH